MRIVRTSLVVGLLFATAALVVQTAQAPRATRSAPASAGFAPERLTRIDALLQQYVDENRIAGAVALVLRDGQPAYERAFGWSDKEAGVRMATDTIFRIASQTKAITATAAMALMEEGKLTLSDPVGQYIPSFARTTVAVARDGSSTIVPAKRPITIRDLMTHTSGISYGTEPAVAGHYEAKGFGPAAGFGWYVADKDEPICESMARLGTLPFVAQPGEQWVYGYNTDVLGCIVERASGMSLDAFVRARITEPLGMRDTQCYLPPGQKGRLAAVYASGADGHIVRAPEGARGQGHYVEGPRKSFSGGAGLLSTARDYGRFLEMMRRGGTLDGVRILSPRTVQLMTTNQIAPLRVTFDGTAMGLGFGVTDRFGVNGLDGAGAFGWGGAYSTLYRVDPESHVVLMLMTQMLPDQTDLQRKFPALVYQALGDVVR